MTASPTFRLGSVDAVRWLRWMASESVDLFIFDPPYESLEKHRKRGTTTRLKHSAGSSNDWFEIFPNARFPELFGELYRVLRRHSHLYMWCDAETMFVVKPIAEEAGFKFWKPLVADKQKIGMGYHYRARYELILFFEKGKRNLNNWGVPDILPARRIDRGYPTEKPVETHEILIRQSTDAGALVVDPFCGSGPAGVAAARLGRNFAGNDTKPAALELTRARLLEAGAVELAGDLGPVPASERQLAMFAAPADGDRAVEAPPCSVWCSAGEVELELLEEPEDDRATAAPIAPAAKLSLVPCPDAAPTPAPVSLIVTPASSPAATPSLDEEVST